MSNAQRRNVRTERSYLSTVAGSPADRLAAAVARTARATRGRRPSGLAHPDADDIIGTIDTDDASGFDPRPVLEALSSNDAPAVVMGQVAGILHGSLELTGDLDLLWSGAERDAAAMAAAFGALDATLTDDDGVSVDAGDAFVIPKVLFRTPTAAGDCCTPRLPWGDLDVAASIEHAASTRIGGATVRYLRIEDLITMRLVGGRPKDLRRAAELERIARAR